VNKSAKHLLIATSLLAGLCAAGETSRAATMTVPARAALQARSCFSWGYTYMRNDCSTTETLHVPYVMPYSNLNMQYMFSGYGASPSNNVGCLARSVNIHGNYYAATPRLYLNQFGASQLVHLGFIVVPHQGTSHLECLVSPGGRVNTAIVNF
jgi:hypothetical protein